MLKETLIIIDTETGGLSPTQHSLLTVGFMVVKENEIIDQKEWKIKHSTYHVTAKALEVNGIDIVEFDKEATEKEQAGRDIIQFLSKYCTKENKGMLVGQNTIFDKNFLEAFLGKLIDLSNLEDYKNIISHRYIDLMSITAFLNMAGIIDTHGLGLDKVIDTLQLNVEARHTATDDARLTWEALLKMVKLVK